MPHSNNSHTALEMSARPRRSPHNAAAHESLAIHSGPLRSRSPSPRVARNTGAHRSPHQPHAEHHSEAAVSHTGAHHRPVNHNDGNLRAPSTTPSTADVSREPSPAREHARNRREVAAQPLLETDSIHPPIAVPETSDPESESDIPFTAEAHPGVDDGFFTNPEKPLHPEKPLYPDHGDPLTPNGLSPRFGTPAPGDFPYAPDFVPGVAVVPPAGGTPDVNAYQQKKNLAQGMMDLALLSANANQLRYVLEAGPAYHPYFIFSLVFISASLFFQIAVGVGLILNSTYNMSDENDMRKADRISNLTIIGIFLITVINVFIASFGVAQLPAPPEPNIPL